MTVKLYRLARWIETGPDQLAVRNPQDHEDIVILEKKHRGKADFSDGVIKIIPKYAPNVTGPPNPSKPIYVDVFDGESWWVSYESAARRKPAR